MGEEDDMIRRKEWTPAALQIIPCVRNTIDEGQKNYKILPYGKFNNNLKNSYVRHLACFGLQISENVTEISLSNKESHWPK